MVSIQHCTIRYPRVTAVENLSLKLNDGIIYGLIGPNGAGKSSLINAMVGLISEYEGQIYYDDLLLSDNRQKVKSLFGFAPEDPDLYPFLTAREYLQMIADIRQAEAHSQIESLLQNLYLTDVSNDLIDRYSHGMRQKVSFAAAMIGHPQNLICDEALNGFDPIATFYVKKMLRNLALKGHMVLLSSHVLELLENWCDEIIIMHQGRIIAQHTLSQISEIQKDTGRSFQEYFVNLISDQSL